MGTTISQREARRLKARVAELERREQERRRRWSADWPGGVLLTSCKWEPNQVTPVTIRTARLLGHAVVVTADDEGLVRFYGVTL